VEGLTSKASMTFADPVLSGEGLRLENGKLVQVCHRKYPVDPRPRDRCKITGMAGHEKRLLLKKLAAYLRPTRSTSRNSLRGPNRP